jgi:hypothetical protein
MDVLAEDVRVQCDSRRLETAEALEDGVRFIGIEFNCLAGGGPLVGGSRHVLRCIEHELRTSCARGTCVVVDGTAGVYNGERIWAWIVTGSVVARETVAEWLRDIQYPCAQVERLLWPLPGEGLVDFLLRSVGRGFGGGTRKYEEGFLDSGVACVSEGRKWNVLKDCLAGSDPFASGASVLVEAGREYVSAEGSLCVTCQFCVECDVHGNGTGIVQA